MMRIKTFGALLLLALLMSVTTWAQERATTALAPLQLIDSNPLGEWVSGQPATFTFDRPLDCSAGTVQIETPADAAGETTCAGDSLTFNLTTPLQRGLTYRLVITGATGADGALLTAPLAVDLLAQSALQVSSFNPTDGRDDVATDTTLTVTFNRPVVALVSLDEQAGLPSPLSFDPPLVGNGTWVNTSIYQFTPDPALPGGQTITVTVDGLTALDGAPMDGAFVSRFMTVSPVVIDALPTFDAPTDLDTAVQVRFNQPMDQASTEAAFYLRPEGIDADLPGTFTWAEDGMGFAFQPTDRLTLNTSYTYGFVADSALEITGSTALPGSSFDFLTVPLPAIIQTYPQDGATEAPPYEGFVLTFNTIMNPENLLDFITIDPAPDNEVNGYYYEWNNEYTVAFGLDAQTAYTITIAPGMPDKYGNTINTPLSFSFGTRSFAPELSLNVPGGEVGIYDAGRDVTELFVTYMNVEKVDLTLSRVNVDNLIDRLMQDDYYNINTYFEPRPEDVLRQWSIPGEIREARMLELVNVGESPADGESIAPVGAVSCPDAMPSRTRIGDRVTVTTEPDPLRARSAPKTGEIVELLYKGYLMPIVGGPECIDGILWWEVELRDARTGWVAEGLADEYFFEVTVEASAASVVIPPDVLTGGALPIGAYLLTASAPDILSAPSSHIMVVANTALVMKHGIDTVTVWATDIHTGQSLPNLPVSLLYNIGTDALYDQPAVTDANGLATFTFGRRSDLSVPLMAAVRTADRFGLVVSRWENGLSSYEFNIETDSYPRVYSALLYTERPVYRPGQTVYYRGIVRRDVDNDYLSPDLSDVPVAIRNPSGETIFEGVLPLSKYGTFTGDITLDSEAELGYYSIEVTLPSSGQYDYEGGSIGFDVAAYRLPEFQVNVTAPTEVLRGDVFDAQVETRYFFGGPVSDANLNLIVSSQNYFFNYDGVGRYSFYDSNLDDSPQYVAGHYSYTTQVTDALGNLSAPVETTRKAVTRSEVYTVEASVVDETGFSVFAGSLEKVHQAEVYVGVTSRDFVATAGLESIADLIVVDWDSQPVANQTVTVEVVERRWNSTQKIDPYSGDLIWDSEVEEIPLARGTVTTDAQGKATFTFTPPTGGVYKVRATTLDSSEREAAASTFVWAAGDSYIPWRIGNSTKIDLIADKQAYNVGDTAEILITSPFSGRVEALVSVERSGVMQLERLTMETNSLVYRLPIETDYAPTVYFTVLLVKGVDESNPVADFRMGMVKLSVDNSQFKLNVDITADKSQAEPQDSVTYTVTTTDANGQPVQTELGVSLSDLAALSLRPNHNTPLLDFFYSGERLGLRTAATLTLNTDLITQFTRDVVKGGGGGGGEGFGILEVREEFVDTPFWDGQLETDANGTASFTAQLPDNLTTWRLDVRALSEGLNAPMLVGESTDDLISTKPLIIRPVAPRFFVVGDQVTLAAVVNNNTDAEVEAEVTLTQTGLTLTGEATQTVTLPARGRTRIEWPVTVDNGEAVELIYSVDGGGHQDATRPAFGQGENRVLPVYKFEVQEFVGTGGVLRDASTRVESISLPRRYPVTQGDLTVQVEPSLAVSAAQGVQAYQTAFGCECIEWTASNLMVSLAGRRVLAAVGQSGEALAVYDFQINLALQRLAALQGFDGGWGWYQQMSSDGLTTAWVLLALTEANESGFAVDGYVYDLGVAFLLNTLKVTGDLETWQMDRSAFMAYALVKAGRGADIGASLSNIYDFSGINEGVIDRLSLYGQSLLMMAIQDAYGTEDWRLSSLRDSLINAAELTANGAQWIESGRDFYNWGSDTRTTAIVLKALLAYSPDEPILPNAVRWLMVARRGAVWQSTQETAWALDTLADWMIATGEAQPNYAYSVAINGDSLAQGQITPADAASVQVFTLAVSELNATAPNPITFERGAGEGALYYTAYLNPFVPVSEVAPISRGLSVERSYRLLESSDDSIITSAISGELIKVTLTVTVANPAYYVVIKDPVPAGTEPIDTNLATSQQTETEPSFENVSEPDYGWSWWWVDAQSRDEQVVLSADYLAPGTYQYQYAVRASVPGAYNVIPATAREFYFPEVYGRSAGSLFTVTATE